MRRGVRWNVEQNVYSHFKNNTLYSETGRATEPLYPGIVEFKGAKSNNLGNDAIRDMYWYMAYCIPKSLLGPSVIGQKRILPTSGSNGRIIPMAGLFKFVFTQSCVEATL